MADDEHVEVVKKGADAIREWRLANAGVRLNLSGADLTRANLSGADLTNAILGRALLSDANLAAANLSRTHLAFAHLGGAVLRKTHLDNANLHRVSLDSATLLSTRLSNTSFAGARVLYTTLADIDMSEALGLEDAEHEGPSHIATTTLIRTAAGLAKDPTNQPAVETFFRGAGLDEDTIEWFRSRIGRPIEFYTCFISYSRADKSFARRLYAELQARGVRPFLDEKDIKVGDPILEIINRQIRLRDRVILCCSETSLASRWVEKELRIAFAKEDGERANVLLPLDLDGHLEKWEGTYAAELQSRCWADFTGWDTDNAVFERELERVIEALRAPE